MKRGRSLWGARLAPLFLAMAMLCAARSGRAETSSQRLGLLLARAQGGDPVLALTALWEALEVAPLVDGGPGQLQARAQALTRSPLPLLAGEASLVLARLALGTAPEGQLRAGLASHGIDAGALHVGHVLGPFAGPGPGSGLPAPTTAPEDATSFEQVTHLGKHGPTVWRPFSDAALLGPLQLEDMLPSSGDAHAFVVSVLVAERATDALLAVGSNGPLAVWVDGALRRAWDGERPLTDWQESLPLTLTPGRHVVLVRVGHRSAAPELTVRVVDRRGRLPAGVRWERVRRGDVVRDGPEAKVVATKATPADPWQLASRGRDPVLAAARLSAFIVREAPAERVGPRRIEAAIALLRPGDPAGAELHYLLGRAERADLSRAKASFREADRLASGHAQSVAALMGLAERVDLQAERDAHARRLAAFDPGHPALLAHLAMRRLELADAGAALPLLEKDPRLAYNARLTSTLATTYERMGRIPDAARAYARLARLTAGGSEATQRAVALARRGGDLEAALAIVDESAIVRPWALDLLLLKARTLATASTPEALPSAIALLDAGHAFHGQSPALEETRGRLLLLANERGKAIEAFDRALALAPQDRDLADYRRALLSERGLSERWAEPVAALIARRNAELKGHPAPRKNGARSVFERVVTQVFPSGLASQFRQVVVHIDESSAAERYETMAFPFTPGEDRLEVLEAEVIRQDGSRMRPSEVGERRDQGKSEGVYTLTAYKVVRFPPLSAGDMVHVQLRKDEIGSRNLFGDFFGVFLPVSSELDKAEFEAIVEAPRTRELFFHGQGVPAPTVVTEGDVQRLTVTLKDHPALVIEPSMPGYGDVAAWLSVSTFASWEALVTWYRELVQPQLEVPDDLAATMRALVASTPAEADPKRETERKVALVHRWVVEKTRYVGIEFGIHGFKPYKVAEVVKRGYGDCKDKASLLVALLRVVGVPAELVLVRTRDLGGLAGSPATLWAFNHAITYVPSLALHLDATAETSGLRELPDLDQDALALRFDPFGTAPPTLHVVPMQTPEDNKVTAHATFVVDPQGDATVELEEVIRGSSAGRLRGRFQDATRRDAAVGALLASQHPGTTLVSAEYLNVDRLGEPVTIRARARMPRLASRSGNTLEIPTAFEPGLKLKEMTPLPTRRQPLIVTARELEENTDTYVLPAGSKVVATPPPVVLDTGFASYERTYEVLAGERPRIVAKQRWRLDTGRVAAADYQALRAMLEAIARAEGARIQILLPDP